LAFFVDKQHVFEKLATKMNQTLLVDEMDIEVMLAFFVADEEEFYRRIDKKKREVYETVSPAHRLKPDHPSSHFYPSPYPPTDYQGDFHA
jgi:hypothetical protein